MVFQQFHLFPHLSVLENVMCGPRYVLGQPRAEAEPAARQLLDRVGLADKLNARPEQLSGGQQQRVAIARSLAVQPEAILFDEPTSALDPRMAAEVLGVITDLAKSGLTMLVVTHAMHFARQVARTVHVMCEGQIVESGPPTQVFESAAQAITREFLDQVRNQWHISILMTPTNEGGVKGEVVYLYAFDVANEILTSKVQNILSQKPVPYAIRTEHTFPKDLPLYSPAAISAAVADRDGRPGGALQCRVYDAGVVNVAMYVAFQVETLDELMSFHKATLDDGRTLAAVAQEVCVEVAGEIRDYMIRSGPITEPEAYTVFCITELEGIGDVNSWIAGQRRPVAGSCRDRLPASQRSTGGRSAARPVFFREYRPGGDRLGRRPGGGPDRLRGRCALTSWNWPTCNWKNSTSLIASSTTIWTVCTRSGTPPPADLRLVHFDPAFTAACGSMSPTWPMR